MVVGLRASHGEEQTLASWERGQPKPNQLRLKTHGGVGEVDLRLALSYVVEVVGVQAFGVRTTSYPYVVSDINGQQLVIYDWHPTGRSSVTSPHLHVPVARAVLLAQRDGSPRDGARTHLGAMHFPTGHTETAAIVGMLIREFGVNPVRPDWERVLGAGAAL